MTWKRSSWCQKYAMMTKKFVMMPKTVIMSKRSSWRQCTSWRQQFRHYVKNTRTMALKKYAMTSKISSWRTKVCLDIKLCKVLLLRIFWQFDISTMCRFRVINDYVFFTISMTLCFDLFPWYWSIMQVSYPAIKFCNNRPTFNTCFACHYN